LSNCDYLACVLSGVVFFKRVARNHYRESYETKLPYFHKSSSFRRDFGFSTVKLNRLLFTEQNQAKVVFSKTWIEHTFYLLGPNLL